MDHFHGNGHRLCSILVSKTSKFKTSVARVSYNKLLTNLASLSRTGEYWHLFIFVRDRRPIFPSRALVLG